MAQSSTETTIELAVVTPSTQLEDLSNAQMNGHHAGTVALPKGETVVIDNANADGEEGSDDDHGVEVEVGHAAKKKKKKSKSRSKSKRGLVSRASSMS